MRHHFVRFVTAITVVALAACTGLTGSPAGRLEGTAWRVERLDGVPALAGEQEATLRFFDRQLAGGSLGCNAYSTTYFADAAGLRFGEIAPTRKICAEPVMQQETRFSAALRATSHSRVENDGALLLLDANRATRARLVPMAPQR